MFGLVFSPLKVYRSFEVFVIIIRSLAKGRMQKQGFNLRNSKREIELGRIRFQIRRNLCFKMYRTIYPVRTFLKGKITFVKG